jgi:hypothetical protein
LQEPVRLFFEFLEDKGVFVAFFDELPYPDPPRGNDRNFSGGKEAVDNDENDDEYDVRPHGSTISVVHVLRAEGSKLHSRGLRHPGCSEELIKRQQEEVRWVNYHFPWKGFSFSYDGVCHPRRYAAVGSSERLPGRQVTSFALFMTDATAFFRLSRCRKLTEMFHHYSESICKRFTLFKPLYFTLLPCTGSNTAYSSGSSATPSPHKSCCEIRNNIPMGWEETSYNSGFCTSCVHICQRPVQTRCQ